MKRKNMYLDQVMEANENIMKGMLKMALSVELKEIITEGEQRNGRLDRIAKKSEAQASLEAEKAKLKVETKAVEMVKKLLERGLNVGDGAENTEFAMGKIIEPQQ